MKKIVLSDIKATVHRRLSEKHPAELVSLNEWVLGEYDYIIDDVDLKQRFRNHLLFAPTEKTLSFRILRAAHKYSCLREYELLLSVNRETAGITRIGDEVQKDLLDYDDLVGVPELIAKKGMYNFLQIAEQLRFQTRWSQTPRVPATSVLGHSMFVASMALLLSHQLHCCQKRLMNNFLFGLFHDFPEAVTRDIIAPVKRATTTLPGVVKIIEEEILEEQVFPLIPECARASIKFYSLSEFDAVIRKNGERMKVAEDDIATRYNTDEYNPMDGPLVKFCDDVSAFLEAYHSASFGITSHHLAEGLARIREKYHARPRVSGIDNRRFFLEHK